jgi:hypothetical protein
VYRNSVEAFRQLLSPTVSHISTKTGHMQNGIKYCIVKVTFENSDEYQIEAYDKEADALYKIAKEQSSLLCLH